MSVESGSFLNKVYKILKIQIFCLKTVSVIGVFGAERD